jgi:hypothetical protein
MHMSLATITPTYQDRYDDLLDDPPLSWLLAAKPADDPVPTIVWWLTAETLRTSVTVNAALSRDDGTPPQALGEAELFADLALTELADATGYGSTGPRIHAAEPPRRPALAATHLRRTALPLARLLLTQTATPPRVLAAALARHRHALIRCRAPLSGTTPA